MIVQHTSSRKSETYHSDVLLRCDVKRLTGSGSCGEVEGERRQRRNFGAINLQRVAVCHACCCGDGCKVVIQTMSASFSLEVLYLLIKIISCF